jgi:cytochrome c5
MKKLNLTSLLLVAILSVSCSSSVVSNDEPVVIDPTQKTTYEKDVKNIINNSCAVSGCHTGSNPPAGILLNTYSQVRSQAENGNLIARMNNGSNPMPPSGLLPSSTRSVIDQWKADGFLEN